MPKLAKQPRGPSARIFIKHDESFDVTPSGLYEDSTGTIILAETREESGVQHLYLREVTISEAFRWYAVNDALCDMGGQADARKRFFDAVAKLLPI